MKNNKKNRKKVSHKKRDLRIFLKIIVIAMGIIFSAIFFYEIEKQNTSYQNYTQISEDYEISSGWTITSYQIVDEKFYNGKKIEVFDRYGNSLGFYKSDFLKQVKIDGFGKVEDIQNSKRYLHYDYNVDDGKTYYWADKPFGAYRNELIPWTGDKPSVAVNPPLPHGTKIKFVDLGKDAENNPEWVNEILKTKTFYADDIFHSYYHGNEKRIDVYVGLQKSKDGGPESLLMRNVTIAIKYPKNLG